MNLRRLGVGLAAGLALSPLTLAVATPTADAGTNYSGSWCKFRHNHWWKIPRTVTYTEFRKPDHGPSCMNRNVPGYHLSDWGWL